ncbi:MAG: hypothetical protein ACKO1J_06245 [Tagaea sp.]
MAGIEVVEVAKRFGDVRALKGVSLAVAPGEFVAMVFQSYALYPHLTARQNMAVPLMMRRLDAWRRLPWLGDLPPGTRAIKAEIAAEIRHAAQ